MPSSFEVRLAEKADLRAAGRVLGRAMLADPLYRWILPDDARRGRWLEQVMTDLLHLLSPDGHVYVCCDGREIAGAIGLAPPGRAKPPLRRALPFALKQLGRRPSRRPPFARLAAGAQLLREVQRLHPAAPHYYVMIAGVDPTAQGRGLGGKLLGHCLQLADTGNTAAYLETSNPLNVAWYSARGFAVQQTVAPDDAPPTWLMWRDARRP